jgi:hypothetical protein
MFFYRGCSALPPSGTVCAYMKNRLIGLLFALFVLSASFAHADENFFTPTNSRTCSDRSRPEFGLWRCPGPAGYVAEYFDEGNFAAVSIWMPSHTPKAKTSISWRGAGRVFGEKLQWKISAGRPVAAILRVWRRTDAKSDGQERELEELIVLRVSIDGACRVASIDGRQRGANGIAERRSEGVSMLPCLDDASGS